MPKQSRPKRKSAGAVKIDANVRCLRVYPTEDTTRTVSALQTIGLRLSTEQAVHLARLGVLRLHEDGLQARNVGSLKRAQDGVLEQRLAEALAFFPQPELSSQ